MFVCVVCLLLQAYSSQHDLRSGLTHQYNAFSSIPDVFDSCNQQASSLENTNHILVLASVELKALILTGAENDLKKLWNVLQPQVLPGWFDRFRLG